MILASSRVSISSYHVQLALPSLYYSILGEFQIKSASKIALELYTSEPYALAVDLR
jgi:hypothetical protein